MSTYSTRMDRITLQKAEEAWARPLQDNGLWHHHDIRNNFYDAAYLFAAASEPRLQVSFEREQAVARAATVLLNVLSLQDREPGSETFGHWPLYLGDNPSTAAKNVLPAELLSSLMIYWANRYASKMDASLAEAFEQAIHAMYISGFYRQQQRLFNHHEAKYTAAKLLFGYRYDDADLIASGQQDLLLTLKRVREDGMAEYGALPWFWHWIQSMTCVYSCVTDSSVRETAAELLDELWLYRARHYLGGAWIGGRMRSLSADLPRDQNVAFDYVQFGDFELPSPLVRVEFAGLLHYEASEAVQQVQQRDGQQQLAYTILPADGGAPLHQSVYLTEHVATGGILERVTEFDNEQHRWELTLPLSDGEGANRLYLFAPGEGYSAGDPRHEGNAGELLLHKHTVLGLYGPESAASQQIIGVLPHGTWQYERSQAYGELRHLYVAVFTLEPFSVTNRQHYIELNSVNGTSGINGFVVETVEKREAAAQGIDSLPAFIAEMSRRIPKWNISDGSDGLSVTYHTFSGEQLMLSISDEKVIRTYNGLVNRT